MENLKYEQLLFFDDSVYFKKILRTCTIIRLKNFVRQIFGKYNSTHL